MAQRLGMTKKRAETQLLFTLTMRRWEHIVLEAPFFSRKAVGRVQSQEKTLFLYEQVWLFKLIQAHLRVVRSPSLCCRLIIKSHYQLV